MCFNQTGVISTLNGSSLKLVDKFTYEGSNISSTGTDINTWLTKAWTAIDSLSVIWKSNLTDKMKRSFFPSNGRVDTAVWTNSLTDYTRMPRAILNMSWKQHSRNLWMYGHLPPITKTIKVRRTRYFRDTPGEVGTSSSETYSCGPLHMDEERQDNQLEPTYNDSVPIHEDLPEAMDDWEGWQERVWEISAGGTTW